MGRTWVDLVDLSAGCRESLAPVCALAQSTVCEHLLRGSSSLYCMVRCACAPAQRPSAFPLQSHPTTRRDEEKHGMQHDGGRVLLCSSWIGTPRGAALPQGNQGAGSWEGTWQMADQQTRMERMPNWDREPESENSSSRAGRYFFLPIRGPETKMMDNFTNWDSNECSLSSQHHWYHPLIPGKAGRATSGASPVCFRRKKKVSSRLSGSRWPRT